MGTIAEKAKRVFDIEISELTSYRDRIDENFEKMVFVCRSILDNGGKIIVSGIGKSGIIGNKISATLTSTGSRSFFLHPVEAMHGNLGLLRDNDILIALSYSGETDELLTILPFAKRLKIPVIALTGISESKLAKWADIVINTKIDKEACPFNLAPTSSTTLQLVLGDALAMALLEIRGFTKEDFGKLHPSGAIGRTMTLSVSDIMRSRNSHKLVTVTQELLVKETILKMTKAKTGSAVIIDDNGLLLGIFTDGDLRRHFDEENMLNNPVKNYMTRNPSTIHSDQLAVDVLNVIEKNKVDDIVVVDRQGIVVGLVDSQDLPSFKLL
ncbi:MAG TPA: KpsF/GutQ family sugar-phosphate isomerase [Lentisphaeria bacterium]|nr:MAG: hypothetical protein A2X47_12180 [Lentisphaerae bacterium GWF2_38_69]HBM17166.1 KpsF/GutQ family sugar-phosphate isomerase [Lentisphaeria bacterium]